MGNVKTKTPADKKGVEESKKIDKEIQGDVQAESNILKLLLLGAGESGKSTLFKQMIQLYGKGFDEEMRRSYTQRIQKNLVGSLKVLVKQSDALPSDLGCALSSENAASKAWMNEFKDGDTIPTDAVFADNCKRLWADPGMHKTFQNRAKFQCIDSAPHFFERVDVICQKDYVPSYQDVLMCRARTTGIVETDFVVNGKAFKMMDVGGQRSERKKWIHCFEGVTAVIFVAAISEYDQTLYEDLKTNRLEEAITLFHEICNSKWFAASSMLLFLNKRDLFAEKIKTVDLKTVFPEYDGGTDYNTATEYIKKKFLAQNERPDSMTVYTHITCATDADNVSFTFNAVRNILIEGSLKNCGLT